MPEAPAGPLRRHPVPLLLLAALALVAAVAYAVLRDRPAGGGGAAPTRSPTALPSDLAGLDLRDLPVERRPFCALIAEEDVEDALGGPVRGTGHYVSGQRVRLAPGLRDVSHEFGCTYAGTAGTQARAWVFAAPVSLRLATALARESRAEQGCRPLQGAPVFGDPSAATTCLTRGPDTRVVSLRGLFGDAWLTCQVTSPATTPAAEAVRRGEQWCVRVVTTLGARP